MDLLALVLNQGLAIRKSGGEFFIGISLFLNDSGLCYINTKLPVLLIWHVVLSLLGVRAWLSTAGQECPQNPGWQLIAYDVAQSPSIFYLQLFCPKIASAKSLCSGLSEVTLGSNGNLSTYLTSVTKVFCDTFCPLAKFGQIIYVILTLLWLSYLVVSESKAHIYNGSVLLSMPRRVEITFLEDAVSTLSVPQENLIRLRDRSQEIFLLLNWLGSELEVIVIFPGGF